ncbi:hypothetical protein ABC304_07615 [Microbacterium sp. 1P10UB]|uniref:hypothetical protein n=1 Tax=unclassified Microbacterium TaxID=2609290 RepID=UPI0039A35A1E
MATYASSLAILAGVLTASATLLVAGAAWRLATGQLRAAVTSVAVAIVLVLSAAATTGALGALCDAPSISSCAGSS